MGITARTLQTLVNCPSRNENSIGKLQNSHGAKEDMLVQHNPVLHIRSNSTLDRIIGMKELLL